MSDPFRLDGRTALVTGASTGLGQAIAIALAEAGADIAAVARRDSKETGNAIMKAGRRFLELRADLSTTAPIKDIVQRAQATFGRVDILINNAGIIRRADAIEFREDDWDAVVDTNLKSAFFLAQEVARAMIADGKGGKIVNIASMLSFQGGIRVASYTASKSGLAGITRLLANEWAGKGINVNAIAPGYFETDNTEALRKDQGRSKEILGRIPAGRWGKPADLGGAAVFLCSPASDYVHGMVLAVDGGWLAR